MRAKIVEREMELESLTLLFDFVNFVTFILALEKS